MNRIDHCSMLMVINGGQHWLARHTIMLAHAGEYHSDYWFDFFGENSGIGTVMEEDSCIGTFSPVSLDKSILS